MENLEIIIDKNYKGFNPIQFGSQKCPPRWSFGPAVRSYWLLHFVVSGRGRFEREGKTYYVKIRAYKTVNGTKLYGEYSASKKVKLS